MENLNFYANLYGELKVEENGKHNILIASRFNDSDNKDKCIGYLRTVADALNQETDEDRAFAIIGEAQKKISSAMTAEKFLEEVTF